MVTKKTTKKEEKVEKDEVSKYFYAIGRRKTSIARVKLFPTEKTSNTFLVNEKTLEAYFPIERLIESVKSPLNDLGNTKFEAQVRVYGGGVSSQADAVRLGVARALVKFDQELKKTLKDKGYLTRDPRKVERKKAGLKKARKSPQWAKR